MSMLFLVIGSIVVFFYRHILLFLSHRHIFIGIFYYFSAPCTITLLKGIEVRDFNWFLGCFENLKFGWVEIVDMVIWTFWTFFQKIGFPSFPQTVQILFLEILTFGSLCFGKFYFVKVLRAESFTFGRFDFRKGLLSEGFWDMSS